MYFVTNIKKKTSSVLLSKFKKTRLGKALLNIKHHIEKNKSLTETDLRNKSYAEYTQEMYINNNFSQEEVDEIVANIKHSLC